MHFVYLAIAFSSFAFGPLANQPGEFIKDPNGVVIKMSTNSGPVAETVSLCIFLKNISGFTAGGPVKITYQEDEIVAYLKDILKDQKIDIGKTKSLSINAPKQFVINVQPASSNEQSYKLKKDNTLCMDIPYIVLQQIQLIIQVGETQINLPELSDERSTVQLNMDSIDKIIKVKNHNE